jgi:formate hydrogenlyase transcriptional activator
VVGVLAAMKRSERAFSKDDVAFLEQVAAQVAIAVENALDYEKAIGEKTRRRNKDFISRRRFAPSSGTSSERAPR